MSWLESQKASSSSKSSPSSTSKLQFVSGVGPKLAAIFASRGMETVRDLLYFFPRSYEDRSQFSKVSDLQDGQNATLSLEVISSRKIPLRGRRQNMLDVRCRDDSGLISLKWFHSPRGLEGRFRAGVEFVASGKIKNFRNRVEMVHPEISWSAGTQMVNAGRMVPIYTEIEGLSTRLLRKILWNAVKTHLPTLVDEVPLNLLHKHQLPGIKDCVRQIHFPEDQGQESIEQLVRFKTPAQARLIYEEFLKFEYLVLRRRLHIRRHAAPKINLARAQEHVKDLASTFPFSLTSDQNKAIAEILRDMDLGQPMNRLLQGDVGAGKTAVSLLAAAAVLGEGGQVALMAPTEILAEQHFRSCLKLFSTRLNVALLTGSSTAAERNKIIGRLKSGEPLLLMGTHALLEDPVQFKRLQLVMIDEQHRFGVEQRKKLRSKGKIGDHVPHQLVLTATPIPRTLALTAYGDLSVSSIREKPPGRTPIKTKLISERDKVRALVDIRKEIEAGRQAYFIFPLVKESEAEGFTNLKSAISESENLQKEVFPDFKVGLLHGQLKADEKSKVMNEFKQGRIQVLVSTTVVEVGVDVPNATVMVIEHAERFGLSQLHQLRGRVGRGQHQSYCYLFTSGRLGETSSHRLDAMEQTDDGFRLAEIDLEIRGPGEFLGTRQSGDLPFQVADLIRDQAWLQKAREDAIEILKTDPDLELEKHKTLKGFLTREGRQQLERLQTS